MIGFVEEYREYYRSQALGPAIVVYLEQTTNLFSVAPLFVGVYVKKTENKNKQNKKDKK